jgi:hypothetical protein
VGEENGKDEMNVNDLLNFFKLSQANVRTERSAAEEAEQASQSDASYQTVCPVR